MNNLHATLDLETLGLATNSVILSIGMVVWEPGHEPIRKIHLRLDPDQPGRTSDPDTIKWWGRQNQAARAAAFTDGPGYTIEEAKYMLNNAVFSLNPSTLWANDPSFDTAKLRDIFGYDMLDFKTTRCIRTIRQVLRDLGHGQELLTIRSATHHNALDDAIWNQMVVDLYYNKVVKL